MAKIETETSGFVFLFEVLVAKYGITCSAVFGRIYRYCRGPEHRCYASMDKIGKELGLSRSTVIAHVERLVEGGYLRDNTPGRRNKPHVYTETGKLRIKQKFSVVEGESDEEIPLISELDDDESGVEILDTSSKQVYEIQTPGVENSDTRCVKTTHPGVQKYDMKRGYIESNREDKRGNTYPDLPSGAAKIFTMFEESFDELDPKWRKRIQATIDDYPVEWIEQAMKISIDRDARVWGYVVAILKRWKQNGGPDVHRSENGKKSTNDTLERLEALREKIKTGG
jgi:DnaD/phage-associated family protein